MSTWFKRGGPRPVSAPREEGKVITCNSDRPGNMPGRSERERKQFKPGAPGRRGWKRVMVEESTGR